jgi:hypothetical protein
MLYHYHTNQNRPMIFSVTSNHQSPYVLLENRGILFLYSNHKTLGEFLHKGMFINPAVVGQTALRIANISTFGSENIPSETIVLGTEESNDDIGEDFPFSKEKSTG